MVCVFMFPLPKSGMLSTSTLSDVLLNNWYMLPDPNLADDFGAENLHQVH